MIQKKFKAAVLFKQKNKLKVIDLDYPTILDRGQVLVKILKFAICGAQINEINGVKGKDKYLPHMMGHEGYGEIVEIGPGVNNFKNKQTVVLHWRKADGINAKPFKYNSDKYGIINSGQVTTFSQYAVVSENRITKFNTTKQNEKYAPLLGCALSTAYFLLHKETKINNNHNLLIIGSGGLGLSIAIAAKIKGIKNCISLDKSTKTKKILSELKYKHFSIRNSKINKVLKNKKFDRIIDTTGSTNLLSEAFSFLNNDGELILVGQPYINSVLKLNNPLKFFSGIKIFASDGGNFNPSKDFPELKKIFIRNIKYIKGLVSEVVSLNNINNGIKKMKTGKSLRIGGDPWIK